MNKNNIKSKLLIFIISGIVLVYGIIATYASDFDLCYIEDSIEKCIIGYHAWLESLFFASLSILITSIFTFFVSDKIFKKWLLFAGFWLVGTVLLVALMPVSGGGPLGMGPDKELVSVWMGGLFVLISITMFLWMTLRARKQK